MAEADAAVAAPAPVQFRELATVSGRRIGVAQLNAEKSLNALTLPMIRLLDPQLQRWAADPGIACVVLHGPLTLDTAREHVARTLPRAWAPRELRAG